MVLRSEAGRVLDRHVVALGGGHGLYATLSALRRVVINPTAVVTVADNGGSSGRLRGEFNVLPPGDLRMALAALCGDSEWGRTWTDVLQHRFAGDGDMRGHVTGNLLIVSLWELLGDHVASLDWVAKLLGAQGRVLPMALTPLDITARVRGVDPDHPEGVTTVHGQVEVATTSGVIESVALIPEDARHCPEAVASVLEADLVVLGPGSWFSSVIPHLLLPELRAALVSTAARVVVVLNLESDTDDETGGMTQADHLRVLMEHAPELVLDTVIADPGQTSDLGELEALTASLGAKLLLGDFAMDDGTARHDPHKLAAAFDSLLE